VEERKTRDGNGRCAPAFFTLLPAASGAPCKRVCAASASAFRRRGREQAKEGGREREGERKESE